MPIFQVRRRRIGLCGDATRAPAAGPMGRVRPKAALCRERIQRRYSVGRFKPPSGNAIRRIPFFRLPLSPPASSLPMATMRKIPPRSGARFPRQIPRPEQHPFPCPDHIFDQLRPRHEKWVRAVMRAQGYRISHSTAGSRGTFFFGVLVASRPSCFSPF